MKELFELPLRRTRRLRGLALVAFSAATVPLMIGSTANAADVATVPLATSAHYSVLAGQTVTNSGASVLHESLGLSPGSSITGFPPGSVVAPGVTDTTNAVAATAQADLTAAYINAAGRPLTATVAADLTGLNLQGGVYAGPSKGALLLTGSLTLDAAGNPNTVFIFQTDSTLITGSSSSVNLINGAQACRVFWQVGSSATLGSGSNFSGNVLALTSISLDSGVTVHGRALARNGSVTLLDDTFQAPSCASAAPTGPTTTAVGGTTVTIPGTGSGSASGTIVIMAVVLLTLGLGARRIATRGTRSV